METLDQSKTFEENFAARPRSSLLAFTMRAAAGSNEKTM
ncbi:hypothetical protein PC116_g13298 [Phytophthora cactorum]|uniref:Uncharacterized protein n=1 Tax=Phytophthora cactorum TaxID=29920 RepID=A0A8T1DI77_9STRA|nr:hypothetical protein Pcac1_g27936 [Phytophthora cactorum]KAG2916784.1 hypothetical protein PC114_g7367 [Phytophthora cactorum]KAG2940678.1 hypothetical protein PC117_g10456 [Phytophthora cactorum]KAG3019977.1 hypothetical protein PC119_g10141 [Phytophthora cactorum]KAG3020531.1 hypothetical protein PC120_g9260 [Phytophthora cactorum]